MIPRLPTISIILNIKSNQNIPKMAINRGRARSNISWHSPPIILESDWHKLGWDSVLGRLFLFLPTPAIWRAIWLILPSSLS